MNPKIFRLQGLDELNKTPGSAVVIGSAPSVRLFNFNDFDGLRIGVGDMPWRAPEFGPYDYWICANTQYPLPWIKSHARSIQKSNTKNLVLGTVAFAELDYSKANKAIKLIEQLNMNVNLPDVFLYDQRHHLGQLCNPKRGCCFAYETCGVSETIQELLKRRSATVEGDYSGSASVAFHGIALAMILGASPIYIAGIDFPKLRRDYRYIHPRKLMFCKSQPRVLTALNRKRESLFVRNSLWHELEDAIIADIQILVQIAGKLGISIVNTSPTSLLNGIIGVRSA